MVSGHIGFIVAAYAVATGVICALVVAILVDYHLLRRQLAKLRGRTGMDEDKP